MATIIDSYSESNVSYVSSFQYAQGIAQTFVGNGGILNSAKYWGKKIGSPTGNVYAKIYAVTGTPGTNGRPTGSALAVSDAVVANDISTTEGLITFVFSGANKITLTNGVNYCITFEHSSSTSGNSVHYGRDETSPTHSGNGSFLSSGVWYSAAEDHPFYVYRDDGDIGTQTNSSRSAKITGKSTSNSERSAKTTGKTTSNSERSAKTTGVAGDLFSRETKAALPSTVANLEPIYNATDISNVATDNDVFVDLDVTITGYAIHQYKKLNSNNTDKIDITWKGKSSVATSSQAVRLQIYNNTSGLWETLDTESSAGVGVEFTLIGSVTTSLSSYYDANNIVVLRIYQQFT